jgi:hypothetical protein
LHLPPKEEKIHVQSSKARIVASSSPPQSGAIVDDRTGSDPSFTNQTNRVWSKRHMDAQDVSLPQHLLFILENSQ